MPRTRNRKVKRQKRMSGKLYNCSRVILIILTSPFVIFFVVAILVAVFQPTVLDRITDYAADFCKVVLGAILGWLLHKK